MNEIKEKNTIDKKIPVLNFKDFLENTPPYKRAIISNLWYQTHQGISFVYCFRKPELNLKCENYSCKGTRFFKYLRGSADILDKDQRNVIFIEYKCKNCEKTIKSFSIIILEMFKDYSALVVKIGEWPQSIPKTPTRLLRLLGSDKELFLQGRRAEFNCLGIGAFTYYRRVVENKKNELFDEIIKVAQKVETSPEDLINDLTQAKENFQFSQSLGELKLAIPQILLIDGQNPLLLLHSALSAGIHDKTDEECLELATSIRLVLAGLSERLGIALTQKEELKEAVSKLRKLKSKKSIAKRKSEKNNK